MSERDKILPEDEQTASGGEHLPGDQLMTIHLDGHASSKGLEEKALSHLLANPHILTSAKEKGQTIATFTRSHGRGLLITATGVGLATAGVVIMLEYKKHLREAENKEKK